MKAICKLVKKNNGLWYGYYNGILIADGYIFKFNAKRRLKEYHKTQSDCLVEEIFTLR